MEECGTGVRSGRNGAGWSEELNDRVAEEEIVSVGESRDVVLAVVV